MWGGVGVDNGPQHGVKMTKPIPALPGDLVQIIAEGHAYIGAIAMVREVHRWGIGVAIPAMREGTLGEMYERLTDAPGGERPAQYAVVGTAIMMPAATQAARRDLLASLRELEKEQGK